MTRYKTHNTPEQLASLSDFSLEDAGVEKELRKLVLAAVKKAGYKETSRPRAGGSKAVPSSSKSSTEPEACFPKLSHRYITKLSYFSNIAFRRQRQRPKANASEMKT